MLWLSQQLLKSFLPQGQPYQRVEVRFILSFVDAATLISPTMDNYLGHALGLTGSGIFITIIILSSSRFTHSSTQLFSCDSSTDPIRHRQMHHRPMPLMLPQWTSSLRRVFTLSVKVCETKSQSCAAHAAPGTEIQQADAVASALGNAFDGAKAEEGEEEQAR